MSDTKTSVLTPVPEDHPLLMAWKAYRATSDAQNTERWARDVRMIQEDGKIILTHPHLEGSLWAVFSAGFAAAGGKVEVP